MRAPFLVTILVGVALVAAACATARVDDPPLQLEMVVVGLRPDQRVELRDRVCGMEGVSDCLLVEPPPPPAPKRKRKKRNQEEEAPPPPSPEARITFSFRGSLGNLRYQIQQLPHPGLEPQRADVRLSYRGFDNKAPTVEVFEPAPNANVFARPEARIVVRIQDVDLAAVEIGDEDAVMEGDRFSATVRELPEGESDVIVKATDTAGNAREVPIHVVVDTTPPELQVEVQVLAYDKALVKGKSPDAAKITVAGREVDIDFLGSFSKEVAVDPDVSYVEIIATDELGNARKIRRSLKIASPMSADSK